MLSQKILLFSISIKRSLSQLALGGILCMTLFTCHTTKQVSTTSGPDEQVVLHTTLLQGSPAAKLEIHHISVGNGDATIINIIHEDKSERKILLDGGPGSPNTNLIPYINSVFKDNKFEFVILSHYHNDHYSGLAGIGNGQIRGKYYVDLGGYSMEGLVKSSNLSLIQPKDTTSPWTSEGIFEGGFDTFLGELGKAVDKYGMQRYMPISKPENKISEMVGVVIPLDTFNVAGTQLYINLRCVAAWGFTQGNGTVVDNWKEEGSEPSKNDPTLAFVLECGEFRYFFGGDMGGDDEGNYIDQETTLAAGLNFLYKGFKSFYKPDTLFNGHLCGFKANHHGSAHSNNLTFLQAMRPALCVTSAGSNAGFKHPSVPFLQRLNQTYPVTKASELPGGLPPSLNAQGFYFTHLQNFTGGGNKSLTVAKSLFDTRVKTSFQYGNQSMPAKKGYVVSLLLSFKDVVDLRTQSAFTILPVNNNYSRGAVTSFFKCHTK